jgi:two-component sensor histidine kinase
MVIDNPPADPATLGRPDAGPEPFDMLTNTARIEDARTLAQAIVNTIPEPFLVLDSMFHVLAANRAFYETFAVDAEHARGRLLYDLGDGQWNIPALRELLETIIPQRASMTDFEMSHDFPAIGERTMLLNARQVIHDAALPPTILLAFRDITARRADEREKETLLRRTEELLLQKQVLLQEMQHRVVNSLQIVASILMLKARVVTSDEARRHLREAHQRVLSVAAVQSHLTATDVGDQIDVAQYLVKLCESLSSSMIVEGETTEIRVTSDAGFIPSANAVSVGLIVTELVINALKYAFPPGKADSRVLVTYETSGTDWRLVISDNGVGGAGRNFAVSKPGLGTAIVQALVNQLGAQIDINSGPTGRKVSITRATFTSTVPEAA